MDGRITYRSDCRSSPFTGEWSIQRVDAGNDTLPSATGWLSIPGPDTVAAALRAIGQWSLEAPARDFDADDWWFLAVFDAPVARSEGAVELEIGGLAGHCEVWLNDRPMLSSTNMHLGHRVSPASLRPGRNELTLRFASLRHWLTARRPRPRWRTPIVTHPQLRWSRVSLLGRTHGLSPPVAAVGPWKAMHWLTGKRVRTGKPRLRTRVEGNNGLVDLAVDLSPIECCSGIDKVVLTVEGHGSIHRTDLTRAGDASTRFFTSLTVPQALLWWPHTHGTPTLYRATLSIHFNGDDEPVTMSLGHLGFRCLDIDTARGDFSIRVNGVPVFCRGACWTPLDVVGLKHDPSMCRAALEQFHRAGMNMLRVSGSMVYEDDAFYDACDELGILVWQDFMFANMDYPADDAMFTASVIDEATQHLERWQARPSIAVLCGNSEVAQQAAMSGAARVDWGSNVLDDLLASLAQDHCPDVPWWPSSAHGGAFPHQNNVGTTSYYGVGAYLRPLEDARRSGLRFATECLAFGNLPRAEWCGVSTGETTPSRPVVPDRKASSPCHPAADFDFDDVRDHYLERLYRQDPALLREQDPERYIALGRATSAEVMAATFSEWRRPGSACRGGLVWFLRDMEAGGGWGLLDDQGLPKAAFYGASRSCAPIAMFFSDEGTNGLDLHVVNEPPEPLAGEIEVELFGRNGMRLESAVQQHLAPPHSALTMPLAGWFNQYIDLTRAYGFGLGDYTLVVATLRDGRGRDLAQAFHFPEGLPGFAEDSVGLRAEASAMSDGRYEIQLRTDRLAQSVHLEFPGFVAEDDYFHLAPGSQRRVSLRRAASGIPFRGSVAALNDPGRVWLTLPGRE